MSFQPSVLPYDFRLAHSTIMWAHIYIYICTYRTYLAFLSWEFLMLT